MKKASWIVLTVAGVAVTGISLISAGHAYNTGDNYLIGPASVRKVAAGNEAVASALRGVRGTSAAFAAAYGVLFLTIVLGPYRRGDASAWWALFAGSTTVLAIVLLRVPFLDTTHGNSAAVTQFALTILGLLLDVRRLKSPAQ
jgi:hypothetical protein